MKLITDTGITDVVIRKLYHKMVDQDLMKMYYSMTDHTKINEELFVKVFNNTSNKIAILIENDELVAFGEVTPFLYKGAGFYHHCVFKEFWGKNTDEICKKFLQWALTIFDQLFAVCPVDNKHGLNIAERILQKDYSTYVGTMHNVCWNEEKQEYCDGILFQANNEKLEV